MQRSLAELTNPQPTDDEIVAGYLNDRGFVAVEWELMSRIGGILTSEQKDQIGMCYDAGNHHYIVKKKK